MKYPVNFEIGFRKHKYPGKLIAFEGIDGSGKTTQAQRLVEKLKKKTKKIIYTKEPTDNQIGKITRKILAGEFRVPPLSLQYLFCADRAMHQEELEQYLKKGYIIITDRYFWSAVAYGMSDLKGTPDFYLTAFSILSFYDRFISPDYTFFLDIKVEDSLKRIGKSAKHTEIYDNKEKLVRIRSSYKKLISRFEKEFVVVDANKPVEQLTDELASLVLKKIK